MNYEEIYQEVRKMIVMDIRADNLYAFRNFHMNMSYPKKIVNSYIPDENLEKRPNFRYKKINILMGANAAGKTTIGKLLMVIFNFMDKKEFDRVTGVISRKDEIASFSIDFVVRNYIMYRVVAEISPMSGEKYNSSDVKVCVRQVKINSKDSYESCVKQIENMPCVAGGNYIEELEKVKGLSWLFEYPNDLGKSYKVHMAENVERYTKILNYTLRALDPSIKAVEKLEGVDNAYVIRMENHALVIQDGKIIDNQILSSGTKAGVEIAGVLAAIMDGGYGFYYCDEKFSYIHSDIEKAFLSVMIHCLKNDDQLFFTTHNADILDLPLPKHSYLFLKKDSADSVQPLKCISASQFLKRSTDSLRNAVDNDLFSAAPSVDLIYEITELL